MSQLLIVCAFSILVGLLVAGLIESRRRRSYEEYRRRHPVRRWRCSSMSRWHGRMAGSCTASGGGEEGG